MRRHWVFVLLALCATCTALALEGGTGTPFSPYVDESGNIRRPEGYRDTWTHLGTYFIVGDSEQTHRMHSVYAEKGYLDSYNQTGQWPDGTVLIKEVMRTAGAQLTTGASNWATEPEVWFVMVKDNKRRFPNHPLWGEGWGWALYRSERPNVQVAKNYKQDCLGCHVPAKETDFIYLQGYPSIRKKTDGPLKNGRLGR
ncbi:MAG: cytochrome P460 family protein [Acidobacteriota bacterium]